MRDELVHEIMSYEEWVKSVPTEITADALWTVEAYRPTMIPDQRSATFREDSPTYGGDLELVGQQPCKQEELEALLQNPPLP
jgi:hypothetical protein